MVNTDDFIARLEKVMDYYALTASSFADKINVQRSSISHLLSGRNKPSLDFILKVIEIFPEVDIYWILNGKGTFPKEKLVPPSPAAILPQNGKLQTPIGASPDLFSTNEHSTSEENSLPFEKRTAIQPISTQNDSKSIERIVIFYKDGTFKNYIP